MTSTPPHLRLAPPSFLRACLAAWLVLSSPSAMASPDAAQQEKRASAETPPATSTQDTPDLPDGPASEPPVLEAAVAAPVPGTGDAGGSSVAESQAAQLAAEAGDAREAAAAIRVVEKLHDTLLVSMKGAQELGYQGRYDALSPVMRDAFDLDYMARKCVGRGWKSLDEEQQALWAETFAGWIVANYAGQFNDYDGEEFQTLGETPSIKQTVLVNTRLLVPNDDDVDLNYRLRGSGESWRIIDIYMNGTVSELALRRSEYGGVLKRDGFDRLVTIVNEKIDELSQKED